MRRFRILLWATSVAVFALAPPAKPADSEPPKGAPDTGRLQPRPQGIDPVRVDLKKGFRAHQRAELRKSIDRVDKQIAALHQRIQELRRERQQELQYKKEVQEHIVALALVPNELARWESELKQTNEKIAMLERRIAVIEIRLDDKKAEMKELKKKLREAERKAEPENTPSTSTGNAPVLREFD